MHYSPIEAHLDLDVLEDEDHLRHKLTFMLRKLCFIFILSAVLGVSVMAPSMHSDLAFWCLLCDLVYYSLDVEAPLNAIFIVATHPISFVVSFVSFSVGGFVISTDGDLIRERAQHDEISVETAWVLHVSCYWVPVFISFVETYLSRSYLQRRYTLFLTWPVYNLSSVLKFIWIITSAPALIGCWVLTGNNPGDEYQAGGRNFGMFWVFLVVSNLIGSFILVRLVRYRSEYSDFDDIYSNVSRIPPVQPKKPRWSKCLPIN